MKLTDNEHGDIEETNTGLFYCVDCGKIATTEEVLKRVKCAGPQYD